MLKSNFPGKENIEKLKDINSYLKSDLKHEFKQKLTERTALSFNYCFECKSSFFKLILRQTFGIKKNFQRSGVVSKKKH